MSNATEHSLVVSVASLIVWEPVQDADYRPLAYFWFSDLVCQLCAGEAVA
jgi:hypothetical protein